MYYFCKEDVLAPKHSELEIVWLFGGEAQLVESPARAKRFFVEVERRHPVTMRKAPLIVLSMRPV